MHSSPLPLVQVCPVPQACPVKLQRNWSKHNESFKFLFSEPWNIGHCQCQIWFSAFAFRARPPPPHIQLCAKYHKPDPYSYWETDLIISPKDFELRPPALWWQRNRLAAWCLQWKTFKEIDQLQAVICWVINHCLEASCQVDQITSSEREWFIFLQMTNKLLNKSHTNHSTNHAQEFIYFVYNT